MMPFPELCGRLYGCSQACHSAEHDGKEMELGNMTLRDHFERSGNWLFRRRSYLPLFLLAVLLPAVVRVEHPRAPHRLLWEVTCLAISLGGFAIRVLAVTHAAPGTSGRGTQEPIAEGLNT